MSTTLNLADRLLARGRHLQFLGRTQDAVRILNRLDKTLDFRFIAEEMANMIPRELDFINEGHNAEAIESNRDSP